MIFEPAPIARLVSTVFNARALARIGLYCECDEPTQAGSICYECERCIRSVEIQHVLDIVTAHDFEPSDRFPEMCARCTNWADHPRHHGHSDVGQLRDGTPVNPT